MKILFTLLSLLLIIQLPVNSQVLINEIQTSNKSTRADEDGDYEDWIELFNASSSLINLEDFGLSDNPLEPFKWKLPNVELSPGGHLLVFASGKDRKPLLNHWETAIFADESWKYFIGTENPPFNWKENNFPAAGWLEGPGGMGYGDGDDGTIIPSTISVFMRKTFMVPDKAAISYCVLHMDYDDGFVAYLNGFEIARSNLTGIPPAFDEITTSDHEAQMYQGGIPEVYLVDSLLLNAILVDGQNVLAIQTHNSGALSSDLSSIPFLSFGIKNSNSYFQPTPAWFPAYSAGNYHTNFKLKHSGETVVLSSPNGDLLDQVQLSFTDLDHSQCRVPDGGSGWCISMNPTPDGSNNSTVCYSGYTVRPEFTTVPGFYNQETEVAITTSNPGSTIHYTTNGNIPNESDPVYSLPLYIGSTTVIRARCFGPSGFLPGKVNTGTFLIGEANPKLPVVSVSTDSSNLWDFFSGIYVTGPNAEPNFPFFGANFWQPWEKDCHVEYFGPVQERKFELDAGLSIHGGWSRAFAQKSFNIKCRPYYDSSDIHYKLFGDKPMMDYSGFILRNSGNDWLSTCMRDALMQRLMKKSHVDYTGYCPAVTYLNGSYWGIYNIRERSNKDFVELNHGVDADNVDMIESDGIIAEGNSDSFWEMVEFMTTHELSLPENYAIADSWWDLENFADYFIGETYYVNDDWIGDWTNNIKLWRERKPGSEWRYIFWDLDFGLGYYSDFAQNKLAVAMNPPYPTPHADMFRGLLANDGFRKYFINRYADLINTTYQPAYMSTFINEMKDSIAAEIPNVWLRWNGYSDSTEWLNNIDYMNYFISNRPSFARQHIMNTFNLEALVQVKLEALPSSAGEIKINTIIPEPLPWTGTYFDGNPITITAVAKPGYTFEYWLPNSYISMNTSQSLTINLDHFDTFKAVFTGSAEPAKAIISEVNYHSDSTINAGDWIELHNYSSQPLDLTDWHIYDSQHYHDFVFPTSTLIPSNGHLVIAEEPVKFQLQHPGISCLGPLGFSLNNTQETLKLVGRLDDTICSFTYYDSIPWLTAADGYGRTLEFNNPGNNINDPANWFTGCVGGSPGSAYSPCEDELVISEINYNSADWADAGDWVELKNTTSTTINLSGWKFSDSDIQHLYTLPSGSNILPGEFMVLYSDAQNFATTFPWVNNKSGPFTFGLSGSGEALRLYDPSGKLRFSVIFDDESPWPTEPDGQGYTLELADVSGVMCDGNNWFAGCLQGSPGGPYVYPCHTAVDETEVSEFIVFPNPANSQLFILNQSNEDEIAEIQIMDTYGRLLLEKKMNFPGKNPARLQLDLLNTGIYFLKIQTEKKDIHEIHKVVISR